MDFRRESSTTRRKKNKRDNNERGKQKVVETNPVSPDHIERDVHDFQQVADVVMTAMGQKLISKDDTFGYLRKLGMEPFNGTGGVEEAETWMREVEKAYKIAHLADHQKVMYATHFLKKDAQDWWEMVKAQSGKPEQLTWAEFKDAFKKYYLSEAYKGRKMSEFLSLEQGDMTVEEYDRKFRSLLRHVPKIAEDDLMKQHRFFDGLKYKLKKMIVGTSFYSHHEMVEAAIRSEYILNSKDKGKEKEQQEEKEQMKDREKLQHKSDYMTKRYRKDYHLTRSNPEDPEEEVNKSRAKSISTSRSDTSKSQKDIERKTYRTCFNCGKVGHYSWECRVTRRRECRSANVKADEPKSL